MEETLKQPQQEQKKRSFDQISSDFPESSGALENEVKLYKPMSQQQIPQQQQQPSQQQVPAQQVLSQQQAPPLQQQVPLNKSRFSESEHSVAPQQNEPRTRKRSIPIRQFSGTRPQSEKEVKQFTTLDSLVALVSHHERTVTEADIRNSFGGIGMHDLLPRIFNHNIPVTENSCISLEHLLRTHGPSTPWLINLINKVTVVEARFLYCLLNLNVLQNENVLLQQQCARMQFSQQKVVNELELERQRTATLLAEKNSYASSLGQLWKGCQTHAEMNNSDEMYKYNGVNVDCFDLVKENYSLIAQQPPPPSSSSQVQTRQSNNNQYSSSEERFSVHTEISIPDISRNVSAESSSFEQSQQSALNVLAAKVDKCIEDDCAEDLPPSCSPDITASNNMGDLSFPATNITTTNSTTTPISASPPPLLENSLLKPVEEVRNF